MDEIEGLDDHEDEDQAKEVENRVEVEVEAEVKAKVKAKVEVEVSFGDSGPTTSLRLLRRHDKRRRLCAWYSAE